MLLVLKLPYLKSVREEGGKIQSIDGTISRIFTCELWHC